MRSIAFNIKSITTGYDGKNFTGLINYDIMTDINTQFVSGNEIIINTEYDVGNTQNFLDAYGVCYSRIVDISPCVGLSVGPGDLRRTRIAHATATTK